MNLEVDLDLKGDPNIYILILKTFKLVL